MPFKKTPEIYSQWQSMKQRCYNSNFKQYKDYGGRGITVCSSWLTSYRTFESDMLPRPPGTTLDRIDNNLGYSPDNCKWSTRTEQQRNQRTTIKVVIEGVEYIACALAEEIGIKTDSLVDRVNRGLSKEEIFNPEKAQYVFSKEDTIKANRVAKNLKLAMTQCKRGHEFTPENTRITPEGWRNCRACHRIKMRKRNAMKK